MPPTREEKYARYASLFGGGEWKRVGRWEVNTRTGERRAIPGLELGALPEDLDTSSSLTLPSLGDVGSSVLAGVAKIPGSVARGAGYAAETLNDALLPGFNAKAREWNDDLGLGTVDSVLEPYDRMVVAPTAVDIPAFTDQPIKSSVMSAAQSLPETLGIALTGGAGQVYSTANQANISYEEMKERGVPDLVARPTSLAVGAVQGLLPVSLSR